MISPFSRFLDETADDSRAQHIGKCKKCLYFDVEREKEDATDETLAPCLHPDLEEFELIVSGDSGCNLFELADEIADEEETTTDPSTLETDARLTSGR